MLLATLNTLPNFLLYLAVSVALFGAFLTLYTKITPQDEFRGIREGNIAPAISLGGASIGFALPLASVISHSSHVVDVLVWGIVALLVQLATFFVARMVVPNACQKIDSNCAASGVYLAMMAITMGILQAACLTY